MDILSFKEHIGVWDGNLTVLDLSLRSIMNLHEQSPKSDGYSNVDGWQKTGLHKMPEFNSLKEMIIDNCFDYLQSYHIERPRLLECVHLFANINGRGASNMMHHHTYGQISGTYWLKTPPRCGDLFIMSPFTNRYLNTSVVPKSDHNACVIKPKANKGVYFNSNLIHYVDVNRSEKSRVSIAFHILIHA